MSHAEDAASRGSGILGWVLPAARSVCRVTSGDLERIPTPAIGFGALSDADFRYQRLGTREGDSVPGGDCWSQAGLRSASPPELG